MMKMERVKSSDDFDTDISSRAKLDLLCTSQTGRHKLFPETWFLSAAAKFSVTDFARRKSKEESNQREKWSVTRAEKAHD